MKIGIFGGSFDPVHSEHVQVAKSAIESLSLDKLFVVPAAVPPHKQGKILSSNEHRLEACRLAFSETEKVEVCDYEIQKGGNSYTYLTCEHFKSSYPNAELYFIVGTDMLRDFPTWRYPERILAAANLAVCARDEKDGWVEEEKRIFSEKFGRDFLLVHYNGKPVSSTKIRVFAAAGLDLTPFVGEKVAAYIEKNGLYKIKHADRALALLPPSRVRHTIAVAVLAAELAAWYKISERKAVAAALFHDCAKYLSLSDPLLSGFSVESDVPPPVVHQYAGAYLAEHEFGVTDEEVLSAVRYHTSGKAEMTTLEKIVFLADMLEEGRAFSGVEELRKLLFIDLDACMRAALERSLEHLKENKKTVYPLTERAFEYYCKKEK